MPAGSTGEHHASSATKSRACGLSTHPVVQLADKIVGRSFFQQDFCQPRRQFGIGESRIHVLAANRRHQMGGVSTQKNPAFAEAFRREALHAKTALPRLRYAIDIDAGAA